MSSDAESQIAQNLRIVIEKIGEATRKAGRTPSEIQLVAVSKTFGADAVLHAVDAGQLRFGENRIQEAEGKIGRFRASTPRLEWHLIGHLQSNKARRAAELFDVVHSVDSAKLAERLNQACRETGKNLSVLVQVDLGHEVTKFGADENEAREIVDAASRLSNIRLNGLMTIPPFSDDPELTRPYFIRLREFRDVLEAERPGCLGQLHLSMGMTNDFEVAIEEGSTLVRIGTALFGERLG